MEELAGDMEDHEAKKKNNLYSDKQRALFYYYNRMKLWETAPSSRKAGISKRIAQAWAKRLKKNSSWSTFEKDTNKVNQSTFQLQEKYKEHLVQF